MAAYTLPRGVERDTSRLRAALFDGPEPNRVAVLAARVRELEAKLRAIEAHPDIDAAAVRAAITHTRLVCSAHGYALAEIDSPPPAPGATVAHDGSRYTVWKLGPSPLPGDARRCAVLV